MTTYQERYTRTSLPALLYCGTATFNNVRLIKDGETWENFSEEVVDSYLQEGSEMLTGVLKDFIKPGTAYSPLVAKELRFMLEALIEVKEVFRSEYPPILQQE
jgi:hypothetical protein